MAQRKPVDDGKTQRQKFVDAAREHGASEDADAFRRIGRKIATAPPMPKPKASRKTKS